MGLRAPGVLSISVFGERTKAVMNLMRWILYLNLFALGSCGGDAHKAVPQLGSRERLAEINRKIDITLDRIDAVVREISEKIDKIKKDIDAMNSEYMEIGK